MKTKSKLVKNQVKRFSKEINWHGGKATITAEVRYDDECGNGHNTFSITGDIRYPNAGDIEIGGCIHEEIAKYFPELAYLIKWHLCTSDGPMYYLENTLYHTEEHAPNKAWIRAKYVNEEGFEVSDCQYLLTEDALEIKARNPKRYEIKLDEKTRKAADIEAARHCAIWPEATIEQLRDKKQLLDRLPGLIAEFRKDIEGLGFTY